MEEGGGEQINIEETLFLFLPWLPPFIPIFALVPFFPTNSHGNTSLFQAFRWGGGGFPPLVSPRFFFLREFFSRALLYERLEQATETLATQAYKK